MKTQFDEQGTITVRNCPPGLRHKIKVAAAQEGVTMRELIINLLEKFLEGRAA